MTIQDWDDEMFRSSNLTYMDTGFDRSTLESQGTLGGATALDTTQEDLNQRIWEPSGRAMLASVMPDLSNMTVPGIATIGYQAHPGYGGAQHGGVPQQYLPPGPQQQMMPQQQFPGHFAGQQHFDPPQGGSQGEGARGDGAEVRYSSEGAASRPPQHSQY